MKNILIVSGWTIGLFVGLTLLTAEIGAPSDGNNTFGFPLTFFKEYGGRRTYYPPNEFSVLNVVLDLLGVFLVVLIVRTVFSKLKNGTMLQKETR